MVRTPACVAVGAGSTPARPVCDVPTCGEPRRGTARLCASHYDAWMEAGRGLYDAGMPPDVAWRVWLDTACATDAYLLAPARHA